MKKVDYDNGKVNSGWDRDNCEELLKNIPITKGEVKRKTLISMLETLDMKCEMLKGVAERAEKLNQKLHRTEQNFPDKKYEKDKEDEDTHVGNIVELLELIADKMETQISIIHRNIEDSIQMID